MSFFKYHWKALLWIVVICAGSLTPSSDLPNNSFFAQIPHFDKMAHCGLYFVFTLLLISGFLRQYPDERGKAYLVSGLLAFALGVSMEFAQSIMHAGRTGDFYDAVANTIGVLLALLLFGFIKRLIPRVL